MTRKGSEMIVRSEDFKVEKDGVMIAGVSTIPRVDNYTSKEERTAGFVHNLKLAGDWRVEVFEVVKR